MLITRGRAIHLLLALLVVMVDRWTKHLAATRISLYSRGIQIIPGFFRLTHTENTGAAFSLFADSPAHWKTALLIGFSVVAMVIVSALLWKQQAFTTTAIALSLILGGAAGNLWDRVASGRVVDFLLFYIKQYQWPVFNLADSSIVVGACLLVIEILFSHPKSLEHQP